MAADDQTRAAASGRCLRVPPMPCPDPSCRETGGCFEQRRVRDAAPEPCRCVYPDKCFCPPEAKRADAASKIIPLDISEISLVNALCRLLRDDDREIQVTGMVYPVPASAVARYLLGEAEATRA